MSPKTGAILLEQIAPRLRTTVVHIKPVGSEDSEELYQDGLAMAAKMVHDLEQRGKEVTAGNICYYVTLHLKSGRRSHSAGRTDVMGSGTQLDGKTGVLSFEEEVGYDAELNECIRLGDLLGCSNDDPASLAARNLDWEEFISTHDERYGLIVRDISLGKNALESAKTHRQKYHHVRQMRDKLAEDVWEWMGNSVIADSVSVPLWRAGIVAAKEKLACRVDRRRG